MKALVFVLLFSFFSIGASGQITRLTFTIGVGPATNRVSGDDPTAKSIIENWRGQRSTAFNMQLLADFAELQTSGVNLQTGISFTGYSKGDVFDGLPSATGIVKQRYRAAYTWVGVPVRFVYKFSWNRFVPQVFAGISGQYMLGDSNVAVEQEIYSNNGDLIQTTRQRLDLQRNRLQLWGDLGAAAAYRLELFPSLGLQLSATYSTQFSRVWQSSLNESISHWQFAFGLIYFVKE